MSTNYVHNASGWLNGVQGRAIERMILADFGLPVVLQNYKIDGTKYHAFAFSAYHVVSNNRIAEMDRAIDALLAGMRPRARRKR